MQNPAGVDSGNPDPVPPLTPYRTYIQLFLSSAAQMFTMQRNTVRQLTANRS